MTSLLIKHPDGSIVKRLKERAEESFKYIPLFMDYRIADSPDVLVEELDHNKFKVFSYAQMLARGEYLPSTYCAFLHVADGNISVEIRLKTSAVLSLIFFFIITVFSTISLFYDEDFFGVLWLIFMFFGIRHTLKERKKFKIVVFNYLNNLT